MPSVSENEIGNALQVVQQAKDDLNHGPRG